MSRYALIADRVWDGVSQAVLARHAIMVDGRIIRKVCTIDELPPDIERVSFPGCTVLPGLIDAHVHYTASMGQSFLAAGVTTVRDVGNDLEWILRQRVINGADPAMGPSIVCCGYLLDGPNQIWSYMGRPHASAGALRSTIQHEIERGVDAIKLYAGLNMELLCAGLDESHRHGKYVLAHLGSVTAEDAANAGLNEIEHLSGCGAAWKPSTLDELDALIDVLLAHKVVMTPTLVVWDRLGRVRDLSFYFDARRQWVHPCHLEIWHEWSRTQSAGRLGYQAAMPHLKRCLARMHERGLTVALGTDTPFPHLFPGFSVHDELVMFVDAGIEPVDALRSATSVGARVLGLEAQVGRVAAGLQADLLVVSGDPLINIEAIANVVCTVRAGQRFLPADLLALVRQSHDRQPDDPITCDLLKRVNMH
jgi:hypothetical protein